MLTHLILNDGVIQLRCLLSKDVGHDYLGWLHDSEVNQYLEVRHSLPESLEDLRSFVHAVNISPDSILFGIFLLNNTHIGNIKLGPINRENMRAEVGLILGDKRQWGKGYATRAIRLLSDYAFQELKLARLTAGCYEPNKGSFYSFIKAGYSCEGVLANYWKFNGERVGEIMMGLSFCERDAAFREVNLGSITSLVFIGGGNTMLRTMQAARNKGMRVGAILARRHASEVIHTGQTLLSELKEHKYPVYIADGAVDVSPLRLGEGFASSLALCFGPAWIFPTEVLDSFIHGMYNFNGIPIPHYMGGAHYTWQILNENRSAGCHIQQITDDVDRGDLIMSATYEIPEYAMTPDDYFRENEKNADRFLEGFIDKLNSGSIFQKRPFAHINNQRLYFPRLITEENGWIDWSWSGRQIASFCGAFSAPYRGASTKLNDRRIYLKQVQFIVETSHQDFHPFCSGLIVRCMDYAFFVSVVGGLLQVNDYECDELDGEYVRVREGDRLYTDTDSLLHARLFRPRILSDGSLTSAA
jgi:RimJ/RimL family protein N-acetyltransferase/methionyl-tRNA formyltransferase